MTITVIIALLAPLLLVATMLAVFKGFHARFGYPRGYFLGFCFYWIVWCLLFPAFMLGGVRNVINLFTPQTSLSTLPWTVQLSLWWPIAFPLLFMFLPRVRKANRRVLFVSLWLGLVIGLTEEILWRGVYLHLFPNNLWLGIVYPSILFGIWHICPQSILENKLPGGAYSFVIYAVFLGLTYAVATQLTGSIFWPTVSHVVHDALGLGGFAYGAWLAKAPQVNRPVDIQSA